jgi:hypothetical protein
MLSIIEVEIDLEIITVAHLPILEHRVPSHPQKGEIKPDPAQT